MNIKSAVAGKEDSAILAECERGEAAAVDAFRCALNMDLPAHTKQIVIRHHAAVKSAYDRIHELESAHT
jgi:uncharacterized protein (TIGR02284 family)